MDDSAEDADADNTYIIWHDLFSIQEMDCAFLRVVFHIRR